MNKTISTIVGILTVVLVAGVAGTSVVLFNQKIGEDVFIEESKIFSKEELKVEKYEKKYNPNIVQKIVGNVIIEEDRDYKIYKGMTIGRFLNITSSSINLPLDFMILSGPFREVKGDIDKVFLEEDGELKKLSLSQVNELKEERILSVTVVKRKEISFLENVKNIFMLSVFATDWFAFEEIVNPERIIFKKPEKKEVTVFGKMKIGMFDDYWTFEPEENQGLHVQKEEDTFILTATRPLTHLIKFENNAEYFEIPVDNFHQNSFSVLVDRIVIKGEEQCPDFNMPCLIDTQTLITETSLSLRGDKVFKESAECLNLADVLSGKYTLNNCDVPTETEMDFLENKKNI